MLDVRRLRVLHEVAARGSLSGAARALDYTQPAISHHIRRLEREVGTPLVVRAGRGVALTDAARALVARTETILAELSAAEDELVGIAQRSTARVRVASFPSASAVLLPPALGRLRETRYDVELSVLPARPSEALTLLSSGDCEVAVTARYPPVAAAGEGLRLVPLLRDPLVVVLPREHPSAAHAELRLPDLSGQTWIGGCAGCRRHLVDACAVVGFTPRIAFETDDYVAVQGMVAAGLGVALAPALVLAGARSQEVVVRPLPDLAAREVVGAVRAGLVPPAVAAVLDALTTAAAELAPTLAGASGACTQSG